MEREMEMVSLSAASVRIMAVKLSLRWMFEATVAVALIVSSTSCGSNKDAAPAKPVQAEIVPAPKPFDGRPKIVAFGDSLSAGFGLDNGQSFPDVMQRLIDKAGLQYQVVNMGVSGDTTTDGVERLPNVLAVKPAVVLLEFGGNDGLRGLPVTTTKANLAKMTEALQATGAKVVLAGMTLPLNYGTEYIQSFEKVYLDIAKQYKTPRIPFLLEGVGGHANLMQADGIHPTKEGAEIVGKTVMTTLQPVLQLR